MGNSAHFFFDFQKFLFFFPGFFTELSGDTTILFLDTKIRYLFNFDDFFSHLQN